MMDDAAIALREETAKATYGNATMPYISCVTGDWQTGEREPRRTIGQHIAATPFTSPTGS